MADSAYPRRGSHFAHRFVRVLQKSCAASEIGHAACLLVTYVAHTEDAIRYSAPVKFWNEQLMSTLGFSSPKQLNNARQKAIDAGWLVYQREGNRHVGKYWVTIPDEFAELSDRPIEPIHSPTGTNGGMNNGTNGGTNGEGIIPPGEREGDELRNEKRKTFYPYP